MKARLTPEADLDVQQAIEWYDQRNRELGDDFLRKVNDCITSVEDNPQTYPIVHRQMRRALVSRFPYEIIYEIEKDEIILRHTRWLPAACEAGGCLHFYLTS